MSLVIYLKTNGGNIDHVPEVGFEFGWLDLRGSRFFYGENEKPSPHFFFLLLGLMEKRHAFFPFLLSEVCLTLLMPPIFGSHWNSRCEAQTSHLIIIIILFFYFLLFTFLFLNFSSNFFLFSIIFFFLLYFFFYFLFYFISLDLKIFPCIFLRTLN
jgi:hypothetical protein